MHTQENVTDIINGFQESLDIRQTINKFECIIYFIVKYGYA